jgi:hypothetical protein
MMVLLLIGAIIAGALGNWWLVTALWGAAVIIGSRHVKRGMPAGWPTVSQLRRRQLDVYTNDHEVTR